MKESRELRKMRPLQLRQRLRQLRLTAFTSRRYGAPEEGADHDEVDAFSKIVLERAPDLPSLSDCSAVRASPRLPGRRNRRPRKDPLFDDRVDHFLDCGRRGPLLWL
jgi:hypothetical protein